jgi:ribosome-binding factor A
VPFIRKEIGKKIDSKRLPRLSFKLDSSLKHQLGVLEALRKVEEDREKRGETQA